MSKKEKHQSEDHKEQNQEEDMNIDFSKVKDLGIKIKKIATNKKIFNTTSLIILLLIISMFFAMHFRLYTQNLPQTEQWAENTIINHYKTQIRNQIDAEYPNLPESNKKTMINQRFDEIYKSEKSNIEYNKNELTKQFRASFQDENNQTYLLAIDPYTYLRKTNNLIETGTVCDEIKNGRCWNNHMIAPKGDPMKLDGHTLVMFATYKISKFFNPDISLLKSIFILPAIIIMLGVIPAFFIVKRKAGILGGFVAAMIIALHPYLLGRTPAGFVDTDAYGITLSLFIIWFITEAFYAKSYKFKALFAGLSAVSTWILYETWGGGWYFTFDVLIVILIGMIIYYALKTYIDAKRNNNKKRLHHVLRAKLVRGTALILITYLILLIILIGTATLSAAIKSPLRASKFQDAAHATLWPNVFTTVAELNVQSLTGITNSLISNSLGQMIILLCLLAIPLSMIKKFDKKSWIYFGISALIYIIITNKSVVSKIAPNFYVTLIGLTVLAGILINLFQDKGERANIILSVIISVLFMGTIYASIRGIRFVLLGIPSFALLIGISLGIIFIKLSKGLHKSFDMPKTATKFIVIILIAIILINYASSAKTTALSEIPQMNDGWYNSLIKINQEADKNAIITSWWDFGHWFKSIANRAVTFDGASQNSPMAHWVGKSLATNDEDISMGILRMLDCGSNDAFKLINDQIDSPALTIDIINEIILEDKETAKETLTSNGIIASDANKILEKTHCNPPEAYYITSEDMVSKSGVWSHFGFWDFKKADMYFNGRNMDFNSFNELASNYGYKEEEIQSLFNQLNMIESEKEANTWISGWPGYIGTSTCSELNESVICQMRLSVGQQEGLDLVLEKYEFNKDTEKGIGIIGLYRNNQKVGESNTTIARFTTEINGELKTYDFENGLNFGIINIANQAVISSKELTNSIFTKLFYFNGRYTEHFEKFSDIRSPTTNARIIVWKIDWDGKQDYSAKKIVNDNSVNDFTLKLE